MKQPMVLDGGLDLLTAKPLVQPGTLQDCLNYERGIRQGYTRMDGIERYDGQPTVPAVKFWRLKTTNASTAFAAGEAVYFDVGTVGYVLDTAEESGVTSLYVVFHSAAAETTLPDVLNGPSAKTATITSRETMQAPAGTTATLDAALKLLADTQRAVITDVPGRTGSDIIGGFWFKNRAYAIRDLCRVYFEDGFYTDANEGQFVTIGASEYEILAVTLTGDSSGYLTIDCAAGSGTDAVPIVTPTVGPLTLSGTLDDGFVGVAYSDTLTAAGGVPPYTWSIVGEPDAVTGPVLPPDPDSFGASDQVQATHAALYKATVSGWARVDLGREMSFRGGGVNLVNFIRSSTIENATVKNTGYVFPTASTLNGSVTTGVNSDNGVTTALTGASGDYIVAKTFNFSAIPSTAIIRGIEVVIERQSNTANAAKDETVDLVGITSGTENKAQGTNWPNTIGTTTYGGQYDLWGNQSITVDDVQSTDFGVRLIAKRADSGTAAIGGVDYIKVKVYYIERDTVAYVWNGTADVEVTLRHIQILAGDTGADTASGWMTLDCAQNGDKTRLITEGDAIRDAASGGGNLLAYVAGRDRPIWLPGQDDIDNASSRYESTVENFYAQDGFEAAYIVCGVGPCVYFDGARTIRIRTTLPPNDDNPRHVQRQGEMLALGYYPGLVHFSKVGNPLETRGEEGASTVEVGDRITGLMKLSGDALGVLCESRIEGLRGLTSSVMQKSTITARRGAVEYCAVDMGRVLGVDGQGVFAVDAAETFGAAERTYISRKVTPWLQPRLQATTNGGQSRIRPIAALHVRSKNQARWYFWDGYVLTMTNEEPAQFTIQRYYTPSASDEVSDTAWPIRALFSGIDSSGRERIFCSFYGGVKEGYLLEIDSGRSFDGAAIPAYVELNPWDAGSPSDEKQNGPLFMHGVGYGVGTLDASRSKNYTPVDPDINRPCLLGATTNAATIKPLPFRGSCDLPIAGYDVTWRFDSSSATEGPHTLQFVNLLVDGRGTSRGHTRDS